MPRVTKLTTSKTRMQIPNHLIPKMNFYALKICLSYPLLPNKLPQSLAVTTTSIITSYEGYKSRSDLVGCFWLIDALEVAVKVSARLQSSEDLTRAERAASSITPVAVGGRPQCLPVWAFLQDYLSFICKIKYSTGFLWGSTETISEKVVCKLKRGTPILDIILSTRIDHWLS